MGSINPKLRGVGTILFFDRDLIFGNIAQTIQRHLLEYFQRVGEGAVGVQVFILFSRDHLQQ